MTNPFDRVGVGLFSWPTWVGYTLGSLLIVIGILCFFFYPKTRKKAQKYRENQLIEYNKKYRKSETSYARTNMYLPAWERTKMFAPLFFGILFVVIGIAWITGNTLTSL